jgi:hypothetical protein
VDDDLHVVPIGDLKEHECSADCWCAPAVEVEGDVMIYIHQSLDGREREAH